MSIADGIAEARTLLEKSEREANPQVKADDLLKALQLLRECEDDEPPEEQLQLIKNIRLAHGRRLLGQLVQLNSLSMDLWLRYVGVLLSLQHEVDAAIAADPALREKYDRFVGTWRSELRDLLHSDIFNQSQAAKDPGQP